MFDNVKKSKSKLTLMFYKKFSIGSENLVGKVENLSKYPLYEKSKKSFQRGSLFFRGKVTDIYYSRRFI